MLDAETQVLTGSREDWVRDFLLHCPCAITAGCEGTVRPPFRQAGQHSVAY